jgi:hypothetical protein
MKTKTWKMVECSGCKAENWLNDSHIVFLEKEAPAFIRCRKCGDTLDPELGFYNLEWQKTIAQSTPELVMEAQTAPGLQCLQGRFEDWLMRLLRVRNRTGDPDVAVVAAEMSMCLKPKEFKEEECC